MLTKPVTRPGIDNLLAQHVASGQPFTATEIARSAGVSRQAVHRHLERLVSNGVLAREGKGRATRYIPARARPRFEARIPLLGLEEDRLWEQVDRAIAELHEPAHANGAAIARYAFTEMVNNAIDHSGSDTVAVQADLRQHDFSFVVEDHGVGVFENLRAKLGYPDHLTALQELSKGKLSTQPERHSGEGIFFTSKVADLFALEANGLAWVVDEIRRDVAIATAPPRPGTVVRFAVSLTKPETLESVFARYTHDFEFDTTKTIVKLFSYGVRFVSRSEAKRLLTGLERFRHVVLDFSGVEGIGQGFADEVFRVWSTAHPEIELRPENMNAPVAFMVDRARAARLG